MKIGGSLKHVLSLDYHRSNANPNCCFACFFPPYKEKGRDLLSDILNTRLFYTRKNWSYGQPQCFRCCKQLDIAKTKIDIRILLTWSI